MIFSASTYAELPISTTFSMTRTRNYKDIELSLDLARELDILLQTLKFVEDKKTIQIDLYLNKRSINVLPNS